MDAISFIISGLLLAVAVLIIGFFIKSLLDYATFDLKDIAGKLRLRKKEKILETFDNVLQNRKYREATALIRTSFILGETFSDPALIEKSYTHNLCVLTRLVSLAEETSSRLENLPLLEELLLSRSDLQKTLAEVDSTRRKLKRRRHEKGAPTQAWAEEEFTRKLQELREKLAVNKRTIESQLEGVFQVLSRGPSSNEVTYH